MNDLMTFYLIVAIVILATVILVYPTLKSRAERKQ